MRLLTCTLLPLAFAHRPAGSSLLASIEPGEGNDAEENTSAPKGVNEEAGADCEKTRAIASNWKVTFQALDAIEASVNKLMRVQTTKPDPQEVWNLAVLGEDNLLKLHLGVEVWLEADCELSLEDLRLSPKISCEEGASPLEDQERKSAEGHQVFRLMTTKAIQVQRQEAKSDADGLVGDWTFESGDFKILKGDKDSLDYQQLFWGQPVAYSATLTKVGQPPDESFVGELFVMDSDCGKFKLRDCPPVLCKNDTSTKCQGVNHGASHGVVTLKVKSPNEMTRSIKHEKKEVEYASSGCAQDVKRSFEPVDADMDAFLCVKVGKGWQAIRGMSYKQLTKADSKKIQDAEGSQGIKVFEDKDFGKEWVQEKHVMEDGLLKANDRTPPWKRSIQATVEWRQAMKCPENFPFCRKDGDCVLEMCKSGCEEWSQSPRIDGNAEKAFNYIYGADGVGTPCDLSFEGGDKGGTAGLHFAASLLAVLSQLL